MTSLTLDQLLPIPLRGLPGVSHSQVWKQHQNWTERGEKIFIQAPSGTGKSTLIHLLYGLRRDFEGGAIWAGDSIATMSAEGLSGIRKEKISIIFQDMRLFPALTAWQNLEIKRVLANVISQDEVRDMMQRLGVGDRADRPAHTLSYGEQQRVSIIRALLQRFDWLLMDEPFSHLDEANTVTAAALIDEVVTRTQASFILADLDDNNHFAYTQKLRL